MIFLIENKGGKAGQPGKSLLIPARQNLSLKVARKIKKEYNNIKFIFQRKCNNYKPTCVPVII